MRSRFARCLVIFYALLSLLSVICGVGYFYDLHFFLNHTNSNPYTLFIGWRIQDIKKQMYVAAFPEEAMAKQALKGHMVIKKVQGVPGDQVHIIDKTVFLDGQSMGSIQETTIPLSPITATTIPASYYFLSSDNKEWGFDSRYAEFGLTQTANIRYQLWPIF